MYYGETYTLSTIWASFHLKREERLKYSIRSSIHSGKLSWKDPVVQDSIGRFTGSVIGCLRHLSNEVQEMVLVRILRLCDLAVAECRTTGKSLAGVGFSTLLYYNDFGGYIRCVRCLNACFG